MSKSPSNRDRKFKSRNSASQYVRPPIHRNAQEEEEETEHEEEEETDAIQYTKNKLYPDIKEEYESIKQRMPYGNEKKKTKAASSKYPNSPSELSKQSVTSKKPDYQTSSSSLFKYVFIVLLLIASGIGLFLFSSVEKKQASETYVTQLVGDMQNRFKEQQSQTFQVLKLALKRVIKEKPEPSMPAIFTIIANKGAENTASEFSIYLAKALVPGQFVSINESDYWGKNPEQLKLEIDNKINSRFEKESLNVAVVDRFHNMPIDAAMIFHGFCDHESAPYKRAIYLFIVHVSKTVPKNPSLKQLDTIAMDSLRSSWHTSTDDLVDSLITRITVNVVNIT